MNVGHHAWKAQLRRNAKFRRLVARRVMKTKAVVAVARELSGYFWAIGCEVPRLQRCTLFGPQATARPDDLLQDVRSALGPDERLGSGVVTGSSSSMAVTSSGLRVHTPRRSRWSLTSR